MPITNNNYNFTSVFFPVPEQSLVSTTQPTEVITIVANDGYTVTASDFSLDVGFSNPAVQTVVFTQSGLNVLCTVTFNAGFIMPSSNYTISLCILGQANIALISLDGKYSSNIAANVSPVSQTDIVYSNSGAFGEYELLFSKTYTADSGYLLDNTSASVIIGAAGNYDIIETITVDAEGNTTAVQYDVYYTYPNQSVSGDEINIVIGSKLIFAPVQEIVSYQMNTDPISASGEVRPLVLYGEQGAIFSITVADSLGNPYNIATDVVMGSSGMFSIPVTLPNMAFGSTVDVTYAITISGDLANPFGQANPINLIQYAIVPVISIVGSTLNNITGFVPAQAQGAALWSPSSLQIISNSLLTVASPNAISYNGSIDTSDFEFTQEVGLNTETNGAVTNSPTITLLDATGILTGDKFNVNGGANAPFEYTISNVAGNVLTVTPNITLGTGVFISVYRTNGNIISSPVVTATQIDAQNIQFNLVVDVERFGDGDITFTLGLDEVIDIISSSTFGPFEFGSDLLSGAAACCPATTATYYLNSNSLLTATEIYADAAGTIFAGAGYVAINGVSRYWNGTAFTAGSTPCVSCSTTLVLCYHATSAASLCCNATTQAIAYVAPGETFLNNNGLYSDAALTTASPDGYYSDNSNTCQLQ